MGLSGAPAAGPLAPGIATLGPPRGDHPAVLRFAAAPGIATLSVAASARASALRFAAAPGIATLPFRQPLETAHESAGAS